MISGSGFAAGLDPLRRGLGDRADLQREQPRHGQPEPDAAQPEHRVGLVQPLDRGEQPLVVPRSSSPALLGQRHLDRQLGAVGQELVQRRVEQPDR